MEKNQSTKQFLTTLAFCVKRRISVVRKLHRLSRGRVALRKGDAPKVRGVYLISHHRREGQLTIRAACARIRDAGVFARLFDILRVLAQRCTPGRLG